MWLISQVIIVIYFDIFHKYLVFLSNMCKFENVLNKSFLVVLTEGYSTLDWYGRPHHLAHNIIIWPAKAYLDATLV